MFRRLFYPLIIFLIVASPTALAAGGGHDTAPPEFITKLEEFPALEEAAGIEKSDVMGRIKFRATEAPFLLVATIIFVCAIIHTFFAVPLTKLAHKVQHEHDERIRKKNEAVGKGTEETDMVSFKATVLHFLGEVEAIFGIWVIVLVGAIWSFYGVESVTSYISGTVVYTEPLFVVVIMALASTKPVLAFAESCLRFAARIGKESVTAWWLSLLVIAPILGSFITEPGAMTIAAMLLAKKFYAYRPSPKLAYGTLGLLFVNISIGGVLTNFAAPPVLMVASAWQLTTPEMFIHFGEKAIIGIVISTALYFIFFRKELKELDARAKAEADQQEKSVRIPVWVTLTHLFFMAWTVKFAHDPPMFILAFMFFLAFRMATAHYQSEINLKGPILVGFFLAGLVIHGGLQGWWLAPIITSLEQWPLFIGSVVLTSFNDNAAITFLASQVDGLAPTLKYAVLAGAVSGGGLTVIANAPNPAGQALLARFFGDGVSPGKLLMAALVPTLVVSMLMMLFPDPGIHDMFSLTPSEDVDVEHSDPVDADIKH
ncbi:MAG: putative Na+/H+ antiporter [Verrucomicrobiales bacterium]